ncbi:MAG: hypothetical protein KGM98_10445 [Bacteroidota bacterium]|nr:hypothetical protein [Bacteroidota bacterium]
MKRYSLPLIFLLISFSAFSQDNYEIQVYGSQTQDKGTTMLELHSNYTFDGQKDIVDGVRPSNHALHETLEITQGITDNFEIGFYFFTNYSARYGYRYVGSHIRPRFMVPQKWHWPVGVSLSAEFGFQSSDYSDQTWNLEIRPIVDKQFKKLYLAFNPAFGIGLKGASTGAPSIEPNLKGSYAIHKVAVGFEYYGTVGQFGNIPPIAQQNHAIFAAVDLDVDPRWEFNFGPGWGLTKATDGFVFKMIIGRRINWHKSGRAK